MSASPISESTKSPNRSANRYSERYKAYITDSPSRDNSLKSVEKLNSPLTNETKVYEGEKYTSLVIKNEDRGEWRQASSSIDKEVEQVEIKTPSAPPSPLAPQPEQPKKQPRERSLPRYMRSTEAYVNKSNSVNEKRDILGPRTRGGITKRVGTTKIPKYKSTTNINAIEDIRSEMSSDDTYIPMAARIKLFEKGLGNGSNKRIKITHNHSTSTRTRNTASPVPSTKHSIDTNDSKPLLTSTKSTPNYLRETVSSGTKSHKRKANSEFEEKLNIWRKKEKDQAKRMKK